jgi:hypothetical protein
MPVARRVAVTSPAGPRGAFTEVLEGETLGDVAARVYGADAPGGPDALRRANRDILHDPGSDAQIRPGTVLRTPWSYND